MSANRFSTPLQLAANQRTQPAFRRLAWTLIALALAALMTTISRASITATDPDWHGTTPENISHSSHDMTWQPDIAIGPVVDLRLGESDDAGPVWAIVALDASDQSVFALLIKAETGQVISTAPQS